MPIDSRIALGYQPPQTESPVNLMLQMQQMQAGRQANALRQAQMENYASEISRRNALLPFETAEAQSKAAREEAARKKSEHELAVAELDRQMDQVARVNNQPAWTQWRNVLVAKDPSYAAYIPEDFSPDNKTAALTTATMVREQLTKPLHFGDTGDRAQVGFNPFTGAEVSPGVKKGVSPDAAARLRQAEMTGEWSPESVEFAAQIVANGGTMPQVGMGKNAIGIRDQILKRASELTGDAGGAGALANKQTRAAEASTLRAFTSGLEGRRVTALNTAMEHLSTLDDLATALQNNDARLLNIAGNAVAKQFGGVAPTNFNAAKQIVGQEVVKAVVNNGGSMRERQDAAEAIDAASTPAQLKGVISTYHQLLGGQLMSLKQQYETGTGRKDFDAKLNPRTKKLLGLGDETTPPSKPAGLSPTDQQALDWANANPNDPRAAKIKQKLGM